MKLKLGAKPDTELVSFPATRGFRWTTRRVAAGMVGVAAAGGLVDALGWAQAWMPNVVVGSLTVAVTITVVERALRNDDRARYQPILNVDFENLHALVDGEGEHVD